MDNNFTSSLQAYLSASPEARGLEEGLDYLLRLTGNVVMVRTIRRTRNEKLLFYELSKHLRYRLDGLTRRDVIIMAKEVPARSLETLAAPTAVGVDPDGKEPNVRYRGMRPDHDALPPEIQALYAEQGERYYKIRKLHFALQAMRDRQPCDRYETLVMLADLDRRYRETWDRYDRYDIEKPESVAPPASEKEPSNIAALRMQVTRALSRLESGDFSKRTTKEMAKESLLLALSSLESLEAEIKPETMERIKAALDS